mmetsp:Transcript_13508/g.31783  ORF Transcript_13508/g.31783 Transcript_13508/m.31783 type:complete len:369 (-) Transcript_13508:14-1120(-)
MSQNLPTFSVVLEKTPTERLGIEIDVEYSYLLVTRVTPEGLVPSWNRAHPEQAVQTGDHIVGANSVSGSGPDIVEQLKNNGWIAMEVHRPSGPGASSMAGPQGGQRQPPPMSKAAGPPGAGGPSQNRPGPGPMAPAQPKPAPTPPTSAASQPQAAPAPNQLEAQRPPGGMPAAPLATRNAPMTDNGKIDDDKLEVPKASTSADSHSIRPGQTLTQGRGPLQGAGAKAMPPMGQAPYIRQAPAKAPVSSAVPGTWQGVEAPVDENRRRQMQALVAAHLEGKHDDRAHPHDASHRKARSERENTWFGGLADPFFAVLASCGCSCSKDCCGKQSRRKSWSEEAMAPPSQHFSEEPLHSSALKQPAAAELRN